jgi:hypothetical protein
VHEIALSSGVTRVSLSPRKPYTAVASLISTPPVIIDLEKKEATPLASIDFKGKACCCCQLLLLSLCITGFFPISAQALS